MNRFLKLCLSFALVGLTGYLSSYFVYQGINLFYSQMAMPPLTPPNGVFPVVWSILYALMIISYFIILDKAPENSGVHLLFLGQLILQVLWSYLFFGQGYLLFGLITIVLLLLTVWTMVRRFKQVDNTAGNLQYPYLLWILFATYLTAGAVYLNGSVITF